MGEPLTPESIERLRRSLAMLQPRQPALDRETAMGVLAELLLVQEGLRAVIRQCEELLASGR